MSALPPASLWLLRDRPSLNGGIAALPSLPFTAAAAHDSTVARSRRRRRIVDCFPMICGMGGWWTDHLGAARDADFGHMAAAAGAAEKSGHTTFVS